MGTIAARKFLQVTHNAENIVAMEFLSASQALDMLKPLKATASVSKALQKIREVVPFAEEDRVFAKDILAIRDLIRADAIQQLMCHGTLDVAVFEEHHRLDFAAYFSAELLRLDELVRDGLITVNLDRLTVSSRGRFLLRIIAMCFDAHLPRPQALEVRYSKAL